MTRSKLVRASGMAAALALALPAAASADTFDRAGNQGLLQSVAINSIWVIVAGVLVMFMQAGFLFLELGFSRGKNVGAVVAKILTNFSISSIVWWACGFAIAFGGAGWLAGDSGFFFQYGSTLTGGPLEGTVDGGGTAFFFFQFVFCAVSLAIVWGTTIERIKFIAYPIYA